MDKTEATCEPNFDTLYFSIVTTVYISNIVNDRYQDDQRKVEAERIFFGLMPME